MCDLQKRVTKHYSKGLHLFSHGHTAKYDLKMVGTLKGVMVFWFLERRGLFFIKGLIWFPSMAQNPFHKHPRKFTLTFQWVVGFPFFIRLAPISVRIFKFCLNWKPFQGGNLYKRAETHWEHTVTPKLTALANGSRTLDYSWIQFWLYVEKKWIIIKGNTRLSSRNFSFLYNLLFIFFLKLYWYIFRFICSFFISTFCQIVSSNLL